MIHGTTELNTSKGVENYQNEAWVVEMNLEFRNHLGHMEQIYSAQLSCSLPARKEEETISTTVLTYVLRENLDHVSQRGIL